MVSQKFIKSPNSEYIRKLKHEAVRNVTYPPNEVFRECSVKWLLKGAPQIYVQGIPGNGKSTSLLWLYHKMVERNIDVQYVSARQLVERARNCISNNESIPQMLNRYMDCGALLLDDLGSERVTEFSFAEVIYPLIDFRIDRDVEDCLPTVIVSNLGFDALDNLYAKVDPDNASRLLSRIEGRFSFVPIEEKSFRSQMATMISN